MCSQLARTSPTCDRATVAGRDETSGRADAAADVQFLIADEERAFRENDTFAENNKRLDGASEADLGVRVDLLQEKSRTASLLREQNIPRAGGVGERFGDKEEAPHHRRFSGGDGRLRRPPTLQRQRRPAPAP